jgi:TolA-binding protein
MLMKRRSLPAGLLLLPHILLATVSAIFSAVFFYQLGTNLSESLIYVAMAVALELAKLFFIWKHAKRFRAKIFKAFMAVSLAGFSVMASISFSVNSLAEDGVRMQQAEYHTEHIDSQLAQIETQITSLQEKLDELPVAWRITKNEYVEQLERLRGEQSQLIGQRTASTEQIADLTGDRGGFWFTASEVLDVEPEKLLLAMTVVLAFLLELAIAGTRPDRQMTGRRTRNKSQGSGKRRKRPTPKRSIGTKEYAFAVLKPDEGSRPMSIRSAATTLGISVYMAQKLRAELVELGIVETNRTHARQIVSMEEALRLIEDGNVDAAA